MGNTPKSPSDQPSAYRQSKILEFSELSRLRETQGISKKIVLCHGVFDLIHAGHLAYLESAKKNGHILVVTITADAYVNKGPGRPYFNARVRANMLAAMQLVDFVAVVEHPMAIPAIDALKPDFYVKGPDYIDKSQDPTGGIYLEETAVQKHGGKLVFTNDQTLSSSKLINSFFDLWTDEQRACIDRVKFEGGMDKIESLFHDLSLLDLRVVGEPIVDTYVFVEPQAISSKSPSISARFLYQEDYAGGSLAIANSLCDFVGSTTLLTTHGTEPYFQELLAAHLDKRVSLEAEALAHIPTPRKTRYISPERLQRIFEVTDLRSDQWHLHPKACEKFCKTLGSSKYKDGVTLLADFGHGLFEGRALETASQLKGFVGINVQTNSSNFGFNPFTKHRNYSYLSIDTKEARVAYHDRITSPMDLALKIHQDLGEVSVSVTLGPFGAVYFPKKAKTGVQSPAFAKDVVDATGAGDAYFGMSALLVKVGCPDPLIPFIANVYAGLKAKVVGHKTSITKAQLIKALGAILR